MNEPDRAPQNKSYMWLFRSGEDGLPTAMTPSKPSEAAKPTYNEDDYDCAGAPIVLTFEYGLVNDFLSDWCEMKTKLNNGEISPNEYFEWKITWPRA